MKLDIMRITECSVLRCSAGFGHELNSWSVLEWAGAAAGEAGEAANVAKKMLRFDHKLKSASLSGISRADLKKKLAQEMADTFLYHVLLAARENIDLGAAIVKTFNDKSREIGSSILIQGEPL